MGLEYKNLSSLTLKKRYSWGLNSFTGLDTINIFKLFLEPFMVSWPQIKEKKADEATFCVISLLQKMFHHYITKKATNNELFYSKSPTLVKSVRKVHAQLLSHSAQSLCCTLASLYGHETILLIGCSPSYCPIRGSVTKPFLKNEL